MKVKEFKELLESVPDDLEIMMPFLEDGLISVCRSKSGLEEIGVSDSDDDYFDEDEIIETRVVFIVRPCDCEIVDEVDTSHIDLPENMN